MNLECLEEAMKVRLVELKAEPERDFCESNSSNLAKAFTDLIRNDILLKYE